MEKVLLLHGALGSSNQFKDLIGLLDGQFHLEAMEFSGHGPKKCGQKFLMKDLSTDIVQFVEDREWEGCSLFGYSMGGYAGLMAAAENPGMFSKIMTLGTKLCWDEAAFVKQAKFLDPLRMKEKAPHFARYLSSLHGNGRWMDLVVHTKDMIRTLIDRSATDLAKMATIEIPAMLLVGEFDQMVTREETILLAESMCCGTCRVLTGQPHPIEQLDMALLSEEFQFFNS